MEMLNTGMEVAKRDFDLAVGKEFARLNEARWAEQQELRNLKVPEEVKEYERILQDALMMHGKSEQFNVKDVSKGGTLSERQKTLDELSGKADSLFEDALARLEEIITEDESLRIWFDRDFSFEAGSDLSLEPGGMPRLITSKSAENLAKDEGMMRFGWKTKAQVKLEVLQEALVALDRESLTEEDIEADAAEIKLQAEKLKGMLAKLRN